MLAELDDSVDVRYETYRGKPWGEHDGKKEDEEVVLLLNCLLA